MAADRDSIILGKHEARPEVGCGDRCFYKGKKVGSRGNPASRFVIVGESPGLMEFIKGVPFIGPSGDLLEQTLAPFDLKEDELPFYLNAFKCLPRKKEQSGVSQATQACHPRLTEELEAHPRSVILTLGAAALWSLTGDYNMKITRERGRVYPSKYASQGVVAAVHPAFLLRGGGNLKQFQSDIELAVKLLREDKTVEVWKEPRYVTLSRPSLVRALAQKLNSLEDRDIIASDIETTGFSHISNEILPTGVGFQVAPGFVYLVPRDLLIPELFTSKAKYVWHNGKFDVKFHHFRGEPARCDEDTMLLSYALNEKRGIHDLDQVALDHLNIPPHKAMLDAHKKKNESYAVIPAPIIQRYQAIDIDKTFRCYHHLRPMVEANRDLEKLYTRVLMPASHFLTKVEKRGIVVDVPWVEKNKNYLENKAAQYEADVNAVALEKLGKEINVRSWQQVQQLFYHNLKLAGVSPKGDPIVKATDDDTLGKLPQVVAVKALRDYRGVHKQLSTYVRPALTKRELLDGSVHSTYLIHGTATGRLSSRDPNLQNIPRDPLIRGQYIAGSGKVFIEPDLSQAELRSLACLSGDPGLVAIFCDTDRSLHDEVATEFFGAGFDEEQKMIAKNVNFGIVYGITQFGLWDQLTNNDITTTTRECQEYIDAWGRKFPVAWEYIQKCRNAVRLGQTITTCFGRKKRHGVVARERLKDLENEAANFPHQSIASDITLTTGARVDDHIYRTWGAEIVNLVHDSILIRVDNDEKKIRETAKYVMNALTETPRMVGLTRVPFKAEAKIGYRWGSIKAAKKHEVEWVREAGDFLRDWNPYKDDIPEFKVAA